MESRIISTRYTILEVKRAHLNIQRLESPSAQSLKRVLEGGNFTFRDAWSFNSFQDVVNKLTSMRHYMESVYLICKVEEEKTQDNQIHLKRIISFYDLSNTEQELNISVSSLPHSNDIPQTYYFLQNAAHNMSNPVTLGNQKGRLFISLSELENHYADRGWGMRFGDGHLIYKIDAIGQDKQRLQEALSQPTQIIDLSQLRNSFISYKAYSLDKPIVDFRPITVQREEQRNAKPTLFRSPTLAQFLGVRPAPGSSLDKFVKKIEPFLPRHFFNLQRNKQADQLMELSQNVNFMQAMQSHWQMACLLLDKVAGNDTQIKNQLQSSPYSELYRLNNARRELIPDKQLRERTPMNVQQELVLRAIEAHKQTLKAPHIERRQPVQDPSITQVLGKLDLEGKITYPDDLVCPLSLALFKNPYAVIETDNTGKEHRHVFEYDYIKEALSRDPRNPLTRAPLTLRDLKPALDIKAKVDEYKRDMQSGEHKQLVENAIKEIQAEQNKEEERRFDH